MSNTTNISIKNERNNYDIHEADGTLIRKDFIHWYIIMRKEYLLIY